LGAYGRFVPQKGFDLLIEAMRLVPPLIATLRLAGAGQDEASLLLAARDLAHVSVEGPFAQPQGFLEDIEAIIVPSRWEAYGLVAAEARAAGRPVLSGAVDGLIEQIIPECGSLGALDAPQSIAAAIIAFAAQDICAMGEAARRSTSGAFDATIAGWAGLLQSPQKTMKFAR
jgi:glycosyltransferase involved in cell wall biosynthesis